jgi:hypothetical protein
VLLPLNWPCRLTHQQSALCRRQSLLDKVRRTHQLAGGAAVRAGSSLPLRMLHSALAPYIHATP